MSNWWGDSTGPYHPTLNPDGLGDTVSDYVDFNPWLTNPGIAEYTTSTPPMLNLQVTPNPFAQMTHIRYSIPNGVDSRQTIEVSMKIYDTIGRLVKSFLLPSSYLLSSTSVVWDGTDKSDRRLPAGVYFITLQVGEFSGTEKVLLVR